MIAITVTGELRKWQYHEKGNFYTGYLFNDKKGRWRDGQFMLTSSVQEAHVYEDYYIIVTMNSTYLLKKSEEWKDGVRDQISSEKSETWF